MNPEPRRALYKRPRVILAAGIAVVVVALVAASAVRSDDATRTQVADVPVQVIYGSPATSDAVLASRQLFSRSSAVVLLPASASESTSTSAAAIARQRHIPMFSFDDGSSDAIRAELTRLGASQAVRVDGTDGASRFGLGSVSESSAPQGDSMVGGAVPVVLVATKSPDALATAQAAGAKAFVATTGDPRENAGAIDALKTDPNAHVIGIGGAFGTDLLLSTRVTAARIAPDLPGGGYTVFPGRRMVALYGSPGAPALGPLGRQGLQATIDRAKKLAAQYTPVSKEKVIPAFEIIVTVASASPGPSNKYTTMIEPADIAPWVEAAGKAGVYVTLDLQPGRMDFLTQAKEYTALLKLPHVGLALDSEWRLKPNQVHLTQIGSVGAAEVNRTADWLAQLVRDNALPQKVLILHQFDMDMLANRKAINTNHPELATVIHADGHGTPPVKMSTWRNLTTDLPPNVWMGWKNFFTEDHPTFTPAQTMRVEPSPWFVSYQ